MMTNRHLKRWWADMKIHPWLHVISVSTISVSLLIIGVYLLCYRNFEILARHTNPQVSGTIYLKEGVTEEQIQALREKLQSVSPVDKVEFRPRDSVLGDLKSFLGKTSGESLPGADLFPNLLEVKLKNDVSEESLSVLTALASKLPEVADVDFSDDWLAQYKKIQHLLNVFGGILFLGVILACSFIIANFMGIRHQSRKDEVEIVRLVGAHQRFIFAPFLWEGVIEGIAGGCFAFVFLFFLKKLISAMVTIQWDSILGVKEWLFLSPVQFVFLLFLGVIMALCGGITVFIRFRKHAE